MDVLLVTDRYPPEVGGTEHASHALARGLARAGHRVDVLAPAWPGRIEPSLAEDEGVNVRRFAVTGGNTLRLYRSVIAAAGDAAAPLLAGKDLVHLHGPLVGQAFLSGRLPPRAYTYYGPWHLEYRSEVSRRRYAGAKSLAAHLWKPLFAAHLRRLQVRLLRAVEAVIVLSEHSRREVLALAPGLAPARVHRIPPSVDTDRFHPGDGRPAARARLGLDPRARVLLTVRRLVPRMGVDLLLEAFALVARSKPGTELWIGGVGSERAALEAQARSLGLESRVRFLGFVPHEQLPDWLRAADAFALPSLELEGFGLPVLESYAAGTPVVVTPVAALPEVVGRIDPELVAASCTPAALAAALERALAGLPAGRREQRIAIAAAHSGSSLAAATAALYSDLVQAAPALAR